MAPDVSASNLPPTAKAQRELPFLVTIYLPFGFTVHALRSSRTSKPFFTNRAVTSATQWKALCAAFR